MSPAKAANSARTAKPPPPVWIGMPSAWETSTPSAFARKQEKSCAWEKIGLRAVRVMTQPICRLIWSSRFWVRARVTGSSTVIGPSPTGSSYRLRRGQVNDVVAGGIDRSEEHTSELQSLMRISYAVFCLNKKKHI